MKAKTILALLLASAMLFALAACGSTPAELLEAKTPVWQGLIDTFNGK